MLPRKVYDAIYQTALHAGPGDIIEVGAAHGAGTVALARGLIDSGRPGTVHSFEKLQGGSRARYGDRDANLAIITANLDHFGVADRVSLHVGASSALHDALPEDLRASVFMVDADGRIDRDFGLFFDRLTDDAAIIVDDVDDVVYVGEPDGDGLRMVDQKHRVSYLLVQLYMEKGVIAETEMIRNTWFGRRCGPISAVAPADIIKVYHRIVSAKAQPKGGQATPARPATLDRQAG